MTIKSELIEELVKGSEGYIHMLKYLHNKSTFFCGEDYRSQMEHILEDERIGKNENKSFKTLDSFIQFYIELYSEKSIQELIKNNFDVYEETEINIFYLGYLKDFKHIMFKNHSLLINTIHKCVVDMCKELNVAELGNVKTKKELNKIIKMVNQYGE